MMSAVVPGNNGPVTRIARRPRMVGRAPAPVWLGRGILLCMLFLLMSLCHAALLPQPAMAAPVQEKLPIHAVDCAVDIAASTPSTVTVKFLSMVQPAEHSGTSLVAGKPVLAPAASAPVDLPAERRARLQVFLI